jgi:hypothetical protein
MQRLAHVACLMPAAKPGPQFKHEVAPAPEYVPAEQLAHALEVVAPVVLRTVPAGHCVAPPGVPTLPVPVQKLPAGHVSGKLSASGAM